VHGRTLRFRCSCGLLRPQAEEYLKDKPVGEVVFRPSGLGFDHLTMTFKLAEGVCCHVGLLLSRTPSFACLAVSFNFLALSGDEAFRANELPETHASISWHLLVHPETN